MELKFDATINLKPDDVKKLLTDALAKAMPQMLIKSVEFEVGHSFDAMDRPLGMVLKGAKVTVKPRGVEF